MARARGATRSWASLRTVACSSASSGDRSKSTARRVPAGPRAEPSGSGRLATLPEHPPALPGGQAAPDPVLLAGAERVLEARPPDGALGANRLRGRAVVLVAGM